MGVKGLWELLAPVGRRVSVETLAGKKLAIDASIWMVQFMKAMRDDKSGDMIKNAHILGFFRRILKLLFLRTKPVFVFDGATPTLKRRTIAARRRHRQDAQAKIRKTAEKLLLNHLKSKTLLQQQHQHQHIITDEDKKGKRKVDDFDGGNEAVNDCTERMQSALSQETMDEMLAASLAAEEEEDFSGSKRATTSVGDDDEDDEEMVIPVTSNNIDPSVLASLPPSMQLDLLVQMRERSMAENRQKYQKLKKTPEKFSELQIQSYLKTVAFRREIDQVQKSATGSGVDGVQSSRIASEANREFIFSSSFTGDKETLSAKAVEKTDNSINQPVGRTINFESVKSSLLTSQSQSLAQSTVCKAADDFRHVKSGRAQVSNLRELGIRMTRDLQRNLDLMKEYEENFIRGEEVSMVEGTTSGKHNSTDAENSRNAETITQEYNEKSDETFVPKIGAPIEISFVHDDEGMKEEHDDMFLELVSGPSKAFFSTSLNPGSSSNDLESECQWEEGKIDLMEENEYNSQSKELNSSLAEDNSFKEVEWEEGECDFFDLESGDILSHCEETEETSVSHRAYEEDADVEEAIRRSLQDIELQKASTMLSPNMEGMVDRSPVSPPHDFTCGKNNMTPQLPSVTNTEGISSPLTTMNEKNLFENVASGSYGKTIASEENFTQNAHDDGRERLLYDNVGNKGTEHNNEKEQCSNISGQVGLEPSCPVVPGDDIPDDHPSFRIRTAVDNTNDSTLSNDYHQQSKTSESGNSLARKDGSLFPNSQSLLEEQSQSLLEEHASLLEEQSHTLLEEHVGTMSKDALENNSRSNHTAETTNQYGIGYGDDVSETNIDEEISLLRQERIILEGEQRKLERNAESVNSEMFAECQELLQMFGLPYIIAPMEAEAQCAYMEMSNLVDGVVTDDSDVFLFGARNVYKNIFDERKYVETYLMKDIETELGLNRETLIRMALLLGSDYTEGVSGIGIVNAIEVVRAFPEEDGLQKFREWVLSPDLSILEKFNPQTGSNPQKKSLKSGNKENDTRLPSSDEILRNDETSDDNNLHAKEIFMENHRNVSKNWHIPASFPSKSVINAYLSPGVDNSAEPFLWGKPDLVILRKLCWERFGWDNKKADELLVPVLKEYNKHQTQLRLEAFYSFNERFAKVRSQRIKKALKGITGKGSANVVSDDEIGDAAMHESGNKGKSTKKASKKPKRQRIGSEKTESDSNMISKCVSTSTSGRQKKRGRGKGKRDLTDNSIRKDSSDDSGNNGLPADDIPATSVIRRSARRRSKVKYAEEEEENVKADMEPETENIAKRQDPMKQCNNVTEKNESDNKGDDSNNPGIDLLPKTDHLMSGGGFCTIEDEEDYYAPRPVANNPIINSLTVPNNKGDNSYNSVIDLLPKTDDHLRSGGGFCTNGNEEGGDYAPRPVANNPIINSLTEGGCCREANQEDDGMEESAERKSKMNEKGEVDLGLRAMPSLRKKRKKV